MNGKLAMPAGAALVAALVGAGPVSVAQAADAPVSVPCAVSALDTAISSATSGETLSLAARCVYVLTGALPVVSQTFAIEGHGATLKRSYAPGTAAFTILTVDGGVLSLDKLNFRNGNGAISVGNEGQLIVNGGVFTRNTAVDGGAIHNVSPLAPQVNGATFTGNTATDSGGAIYDSSAADTASVSKSTFIGNKAANEGGALWDFGELGAVTAAVFRGNRAAVGGALWFSEDLGEGLTQVTVRDNDGNHAGGDGGGVYDDTEDGSEVSSTGIRDSSAADGGGVYITGFGDQVASFTDSTISSNHARGHGGGIYNQVPAAATGVRIVRNTAVSGGGGIYEDDTPTTSATFTLMKSLVRANRPDNCAPPGSIAGCTG